MADRKYEAVWKKLAANPSKSVKVKVTNAEIAARVRKAVQKEKDLDNSTKEDGILIKRKYRLTCVIEKDGVTMFFRLAPANILANI